MSFKLTSLAAIAGAMITGTALAATLPVPVAPPPAAGAPDATPVKPVYGDINPFYGNIGAFWGNINPFYGNIGAFWGDINPFYGNIGAFWGNINPFYGNIGAFYGDIQPFTGDVAAHYGNIGAFWGNIQPFWSSLNASLAAATPGNAASLTTAATNLNDLIARSETFWGNAVRARTGKSFTEGFAKPLLAKFGLDPANPASLAGMSENRRWEFMITWYDQLMEFSGMDHVDHWMKTINWTPAITQQQGEGYDAVIGLIDFTIAGDSDIQSKLSYFSGVSTFSNGHGAGVASLMVAAHDGRGVMGIAPNASVVAYNPFDNSGTTNFNSIRDGIVTLNQKNTSVINMSLGVSGWTLHPDWKGVFADANVAKSFGNTVYVIAAGNDGISQTANVSWGLAADPALIVVGSVAPDGTISSFSNRPGTACLTDLAGKCGKDQELMYRFMVAPGELILVSDDHGGVVRQSGTSLAAPLVSGTIALLHDRWPWLTKYPKATAEILFRSAKDLGAKGVDPVYGWGLLDVAAAQSVLDFDRLFYYQITDASSTLSPGSVKPMSAGSIRSKGVQASWEAAGAYFVVFEPTAQTQRDFAIPLSSRLYGQRVSGSNELFQQFIYDRMVEWMKGTKPFGLRGTQDDTEAGYLAFSDATVTIPVEGLELSFGYTQRQDSLFADTASEYALRLSNEAEGVALNVGYGRGAAVLGYQAGFALSSDYVGDAGLDPLLGLASGGAYASVDLAIAPNATFRAGFSSAGGPLLPETENGRPVGAGEDVGLDDYSASAFSASVTFAPVEGLTLLASYTRLDEKNGVLGVQSMQDDFSASTVTDGFTVGGDLALDTDLTFSLSASFGRTNPTSNQLAVTDAIESTSLKAALTKVGVFGENDTARLTIGQPLHVEQGSMSYTQIGVVDRLTGAIGPVTQTFDIATSDRRVEAELLYATPFADGDGLIGAYVKAAYRDGEAGSSFGDVAGGVSLRLKF